MDTLQQKGFYGIPPDLQKIKSTKPCKYHLAQVHMGTTATMVHRGTGQNNFTWIFLTTCTCTKKMGFEYHATMCIRAQKRCWVAFPKELLCPSNTAEEGRMDGFSLPSSTVPFPHLRPSICKRWSSCVFPTVSNHLRLKR